MFSYSTDTSLGLVACWFTGSDTVLESGSSVPLSMNIEVSPDSDLSFAIHAIAMSIVGDPEVLDLYAAFGSGDILSYLGALQNTPNNLATAVYPLSNDGVATTESGNENDLADSGHSILLFMGLSITIITIGSLTLWYRRFMLQ